MTLAFAIGVFGGCGQCAVAAAQDASDAGPSRLSGGIFRLVVGDAVHRVFAAMGALQVIILTKVVVITAALFAISRHSAAMAKAFLPIRDISRPRGRNACSSC